MITGESYGSPFHVPVLVHEVVELLGNVRTVLDCTLGGGGHSLALLERGARVVGLDQDPEAVAYASVRLATYRDDGRFAAYRSNYANASQLEALKDRHFGGVLLDLGISSHQVDQETRGFTFRRGVPLDMRMSPDATRTAGDLLNHADGHELEHVFADYGDAGARARKLARIVVRRRQRSPFRVSDDFVDAIREAFGPRTGPAEFAPLFQALRIAVNGELDVLASALPMLRDRLLPAGRMVVIAYHSGEDRIVKHSFRDWSAACICPPKQPVCTCRGAPLGETVTRKAVAAGAAEISANPRARSARLRAWQKAA